MAKRILFCSDIDDLGEVADIILGLDPGEFGVSIEIKVGQRTSKQRNALEVFCRILAQELNDAGFDMRVLLKDEIDIEWTQESVKEYLWRPIQLAATGKKSTADLDRAEVSVVYKILNRFLGEKRGIHVPFPQQRYPE